MASFIAQRTSKPITNSLNEVNTTQSLYHNPNCNNNYIDKEIHRTSHGGILQHFYFFSRSKLLRCSCIGKHEAVALSKTCTKYIALIEKVKHNGLNAT